MEIETWFNACMINSGVSLLENFSSYSKSLPVRNFYGDYKSLYEMSYFVRHLDLTLMALGVSKNPGTRSNVRYISAPSATGKTASVLPAFLCSTSMKGGGTHYIYLAFANNNQHHFVLSPRTPSSDADIAEKQGAAFIMKCVKTVFERPGNISSYTIKLEESPELSVEECTTLLRENLQDKLGEDFQAWFHLDEHGKCVPEKI